MSDNPHKNVNIKRVKGNVIITNNQSGGVTSHDYNATHGKKKFNLLKSIYFWIALLAAIVSIFTYFKIEYNSKDSLIGSKKDSIKTKKIQITDTTKENISHKKKKQMFGKKDDTNKPNQKISIGTVTGDVVTSNNQSGGITAHTVIIAPEDKEIPIANNVIVMKQSENSLEIKPKQGTWKIPFVEILTSEKDSVHPVWLYNLNSGSRSASFSYWNRTIKGKEERFMRITTNGPAASPSLPYYFYFKKMPSIMFFGDESDTSKIFGIGDR